MHNAVPKVPFRSLGEEDSTQVDVQRDINAIHELRSTPKKMTLRMASSKTDSETSSTAGKL